jgi:glycosyltransferase involved in cell wall biosynthesis
LEVWRHGEVNVLLVNYEYPPLGGGAANATMFIGKALAELGHEPTIVTAAFGDLCGPRHEDGVYVHRLHTRRAAPDRSNFREMASFLAAALRAGRRIAAERRVEGAIVFFTVPCGPVGWALKRWLGLPYIVSLRGGDVPGLVPELNAIHRFLAPMRRLILRCAQAVVANSESLARLSEITDPVPVRVIPNGVDASYFRPAEPDSRPARGPFRILFVGRLQSQKNLALVLRTFAAIKSQTDVPLRLDIVGDGPLRGELEALNHSLRTTDGVVWHGWLPKEELRMLYRSADVFVNPSLYEGMPNTVLEAMACGLPVVASNVGGNDALVKHGVTGFLFDLGVAEEFGQAIIKLIRERDLGQRMGDAARGRVVSDFSWHGVAKQYVELFRSAKEART